MMKGGMTSMSYKHYVNEQELKKIFDEKFDHNTTQEFYEWLDEKMEIGEVELVEFNNYEISGLDYKPTAKLVGENGNIFNLMAIAKKALCEAGKQEKSVQMYKKIIYEAQSYEEALNIISEYVEVE